MYSIIKIGSGGKIDRILTTPNVARSFLERKLNGVLSYREFINLPWPEAKLVFPSTSTSGSGGRKANRFAMAWLESLGIRLSSIPKGNGIILLSPCEGIYNPLLEDVGAVIWQTLGQ